MKKDMIKFISKASNYTITLKHGMPAEPITGRAAVAGKYIRFENGVVSVPEETAELLKERPGFGIDYVLAEEKDPYEASRKESEPKHVITNMEYGHPTSVQKSEEKVSFSEKQKAAIREMMKETAMEMAKEMAKEMIMAGKEMPVSESIPEFPAEPQSVSSADNTTKPANATDVENYTETETTSFVCSKCGKAAKTKAGLMAHERVCKA